MLTIRDGSTLYYSLLWTAPAARQRFVERLELVQALSSTLEEVGREIGLTRERVRQIQVEALKRLRGIMETQGLSGESLFS